MGRSEDHYTALNQDLSTALETISRAEAVGYLFVAPMQYQAAVGRGGQLERQRRLITATRAYRQALTEIFEDIPGVAKVAAYLCRDDVLLGEREWRESQDQGGGHGG